MSAQQAPRAELAALQIADPPEAWHALGFTVSPDGVVVLAGALLLGHGLPLDLAVHLRMSEQALARRLPADERWTLPAYARYGAENAPEKIADLLVLADHPDRPAVRR